VQLLLLIVAEFFTVCTAEIS